MISVLASAGLLLAATIWGFSFVIVKDSLDYIGAMYMIAYRYTIAAVVMSLIFIKKWKLLNKEYLLYNSSMFLLRLLCLLRESVFLQLVLMIKESILEMYLQ